MFWKSVKAEVRLEFYGPVVNEVSMTQHVGEELRKTTVPPFL